MKSRYIFQTAILLLLFQCFSCNKFVDVGPPKTAVVSSEVFQSDQSATAAVTAIYSQMRSGSSSIANGAMTLYPGESSDELNLFTPSGEENQFATDQLLSTNSIIDGMWTYNYQIIGQVNSCIQGITQSTTLTPSVKSQLLGEAKTSRALLYFYMVNMWGDMPLVLTADWTQSKSFSRSPASQVYAQIISDLKDATGEMSATYPSAGKYRPNKYAALALLARVYLYTQDWKDAESIASQVIASNVYTLADIDGAFLSNNTEAIWQLQPVAGTGSDTQEASAFVPYASGISPNYYITDNLLNSFEPGDKRKSHWIDTTTYQGTLYSFPYKYKIIDPSAGLNESYTILRLAETYLVRAEARAQNNDIAGAVADLNVIRARAQDIATASVTNPLPLLLPTLSQSNLLNAVEQERRHELCFEWGHRWFDLKRTGQADVVLRPQKPTYTTNSKLYPIPEAERLLDINLKQNPGYN